MALWLVHGAARSRGGEIELSLGQSMERLREKNLSLQIADRRSIGPGESTGA